MERTIGEVAEIADRSYNAKAFWGAMLICNAILPEPDIGLIEEIVKRIDGAVPDKKDRDKAANLVGDALEDVMSYPRAQQISINGDDPTIIAIAKALVYLSSSFVGKNPTKRKDRQKATEIILNRMGGRRSEPVREVVTLEYVDPDWMGSLPSGDE